MHSPKVTLGLMASIVHNYVFPPSWKFSEHMLILSMQHGGWCMVEATIMRFMHGSH